MTTGFLVSWRLCDVARVRVGGLSVVEHFFSFPLSSSFSQWFPIFHFACHLCSFSWEVLPLSWPLSMSCCPGSSPAHCRLRHLNTKSVCCLLILDFIMIEITSNMIIIFMMKINNIMLLNYYWMIIFMLTSSFVKLTFVISSHLVLSLFASRWNYVIPIHDVECSLQESTVFQRQNWMICVRFMCPAAQDCLCLCHLHWRI